MMKRMLPIILTLILILNFAACGSRYDYLNKFPYIPAYPRMAMEKTELANKQGFSSATFTIKNAKVSQVASSYEKIFHDDGWKTTDDKKPNVFTVEKADHIAVIALTQVKENTSVFIYTK